MKMKKYSTVLILVFSMAMASHHALAQEVVITLSPGWNWVSYPRADTLTIEEGLAFFTPFTGDVIKSQAGYVSYLEGFGWYGSFTHFIPGKGLMYKSMNSNPVSFVFGASTIPSVVTIVATDITSTSATCGGNVISDGGTMVTERGICWSTSHNPTTNGSHISGGQGTGSFTVSMTGLTATTTYYIRAYAVNSAGISYGNEVSFTTSATPTYTISVSSDPSNGGSVSGGGTYSYGQSCTVTATVNSGYSFTNWTENGNQISTNPSYTFTVSSNRALVANFTYNGGGNTPTGAINGLFSVSATQQVYFSQGNLQYQASSNNWRFATNQYDYIGSANSNISQTYNGWIDLFGWGTSGYNHGAVCYQPWSISQTTSDYYAYGSEIYNLYDQTGQADWGYNAISNGGNQTNQWRTLTTDEWQYVFNTRTTSSGLRYAKAKVNNVNGVILLPDNWNSSTYSLSNTNQGSASYSSNTISISQWSTLENAGAVFLPAAGYRRGTTASFVNSHGDYWSASFLDRNLACIVSFSGEYLYPLAGSSHYQGQAVRLVQDNPDLPTVTTNTITNITQTSATGGGNVVNAGSSTVTARGVCWSTSHNPTVSGNHTTNGTGTGSFTSNITGLTANTMYYVRAYATNSAGTAYGNEVCFTTLQSATLPTVTTIQVTSITPTTAIGGGNVTATGGANVTERGICWSTSHNPTTGDSYASSGAGTGSFTVSMTGLTANTTYYVRAYAINSVGTAYGSEVSFTTQEITLPSVTTNGYVYPITQTTAQTFGFVDSMGNGWVSERGICWSTSHNPTTSGNHANNGQGTGSFGVEITGLTASTTYYIRAYAINEAGTAYGNEVSFTTLSNIINYSITVIPIPTVGGTVTGGGIYQQGQSCTVSATANTGYTFVGWTENEIVVSTNANYTFTVNSDRTLVAYFSAQAPNTYTISVSSNPSNGGSVTGGGTYQQGQSCTVSATAATGYTFNNWTENGSVVSTNANYTFTVNNNRTLVANFSVQAPTYTISVSSYPTNGGSVTGGGSYNYGQSCTVTATASPDYTFLWWTVNGIQVSTNANYTFTVTSDRTLVARFSINQPPTGAINGLFTINSNGDQVFFSKGNLQFKASMWWWQFATNQYDYIGNNNSNISQTYGGWIDLFGWGTSGWNCGSTYYHPWDFEYPSSGSYGPPVPYNLTDEYANSDWGGYNGIDNGGYFPGLWRTLTQSEWSYVFNQRLTASGCRYARAQVNGVNGVILLPDDWNTNYYNLSYYNNSSDSYTDNVINRSSWMSILEAHGCVFLPAAGNRYQTLINNVGSYGYYWSASHYDNNSTKAYGLFFDDSYLSPQDDFPRFIGCSVRLVKDY